MRQPQRPRPRRHRRRPTASFRRPYASSASVRARADGARANRALLLKAERRLLLFHEDELLVSYEVALGSSPEGPKERVGDGRTPEGHYEIDWRLEDSDYHRAMHVSYPNAADRARARAEGVDPGGAIMIHGLPTGLGEIGADHRSGDWTDGCIAVTNEEMDQIWELIPDGTPIDIVP